MKLSIVDMSPVLVGSTTILTQLPQGQPFSFDAQRPALSARGLAEAENELNGLLRQELDVAPSEETRRLHAEIVAASA